MSRVFTSRAEAQPPLVGGPPCPHCGDHTQPMVRLFRDGRVWSPADLASMPDPTLPELLAQWDEVSRRSVRETSEEISGGLLNEVDRLEVLIDEMDPTLLSDWRAREDALLDRLEELDARLETGQATFEEQAAERSAIDAEMRRVNPVVDEIKRLSAEQAATEALTVDRNADPPAVPRRGSIPASVRREVWRRDEGRCVDCSSRERLEYDHIIPLSKGGANTVRNIELRCEPCNRKKGDRI
jgi:hypothetical protein